MACPLYDNAREIKENGPNGHKGLWYERFFSGYPEDFADRPEQDAKKAWIDSVTQSPLSTETCQAAAIQQRKLCLDLKGKTCVFTTHWHFATGLGLPHPVENGFLWHPTLGTPYIPGAAVKGLVRAWMEQWHDYGDASAQQRAKILYRWFGSEAKDPQDRAHQQDVQAGQYIFFDALPVLPPKLKADIMTPHMGKWYQEGAERPGEADTVPADWHSPIPIPFLVADKPSFQFAIAPRAEAAEAAEAAKAELDDVLNALSEALTWLGAGAKTAVGYGQMDRAEYEETKIDRGLQGIESDKRKAIEDQDKNTRLKEMDLIDQEIQIFLDQRKNQQQSEHGALITAIDSNHWSDPDKRKQIILRLEQRMKNTNAWSDQSKKRNPEKDKTYQNTKKVKKWLADME